MKNQKRILMVLALVLALVPMLVMADVGGNVDYDFGGDSFGGDWGGGDWGGGGFNPFTMFYLGNAFGLSPLMMIALVGVFFFLRSRSGQNRSNAGRRQAPAAPRTAAAPVARNDQSLEQLRAADPNFSKNAFLSRVANMFLQLQTAWTEKDWKRVRPFEHDQIFHMHNEQLNRFIENGETNVIEDIAILDTALESYEQDGPFEYLNTIIRARFKDYIVDDASGNVIKGFKDHPVTMTYRWKLMRSRGTKTEHKDAKVTQCPNCGANLSVAQNGICEYCGSEVTLGNHDWVLTQIVPLRQEN